VKNPCSACQKPGRKNQRAILSPRFLWYSKLV
jgi:hypothetical protein